MHDPKLTLVATLTDARTYSFQSTDKLGGWALCTVNDTTGELLLVTDWGNWAYRWNPKHLGCPSLTHFIADRNGYDYLANKLLDQMTAWVIDADATIKKWRGRLAKARLAAGRRYAVMPYCLDDQTPLTASFAREIWENLGSLYEVSTHERLFIDRAQQIDGIAWVSDCPWDDITHRYSHIYRLLVDFLLPALASACAKTLREQVA